MAKRKKNIDIEPLDRHCPICNMFVHLGDPLHRCDEKILIEIDMELQKAAEQIEEEIEDYRKTYGEKMQDAAPFIESEDFFYNNEE